MMNWEAKGAPYNDWHGRVLEGLDRNEHEFDLADNA